MVKMRAYSVTWMDCYCEVHTDLVLLPDEQPKGTLTVIARSIIEEYAGESFVHVINMSSTTYEKVIGKMDITAEDKK